MASLVLGTSLAIATTGSSPAADAEAKANSQLFTSLATALKNAPKVNRITYSAIILSGKMRMALISDGANVVCFLTDGNAGKPNTLSLEGHLTKEDLVMMSNPMGHDRAGSRATFVGRMTATEFSGTLTLSGQPFTVAGRAASTKSPAGLYHLYSAGLDIVVTADEAGGATAIAKRIKTGEVLSAKVATPVTAGSLPRASVYSPTGSLLVTVDVRRVRTPVPGLLHPWSDGSTTAVKPAEVPWVTADVLGNPIRPFDVAVLQSPADDPSLLLISERVGRRILEWAPPSNAVDGSILQIADFSDWRDSRTPAAGQPGHLAIFQNSLAADSLTDPGYDTNTLHEIPSYGQLNRLIPVDSGTTFASGLKNAWSIPADHVGNLVKNPNNDGVSFGFTWTQRPLATGNTLLPRALVRASELGALRSLSTTLSDFFSGGDMTSNAIGQVGTFPQSFLIPFSYSSGTQTSPLSYAHLVTDNSTSVSQSILTLRDRLGRSLAGAEFNSPGTFMNLDGMDLTGFHVVDGARMENDAVFLLTKHRNYWKKEGQVVSDGSGGLTYVGQPPSYREVSFGPLIFEEDDRWALNQFNSNEPTMWALVRVTAQGIATLYHKGRDPIFATGLDVESTPEGKHVLVADNGPAGFGGQIIRVAPSEAALAAYLQRIQDIAN